MTSFLERLRLSMSLTFVFASLSTLFIMYALYFTTKDRRYSLVSSITWFTEDSERPLVTLMTTLRDSPARTKIHRELIRNWAALAPRVLPVLVVPVSDNVTFWEDEARAHDWRILRTARLINGIPIFAGMFAELDAAGYDTPFVGYANDDILFDDGLPETLLSVLNTFNDMESPKTLVAGRRRNVDTDNVTDSTDLVRLRELASGLPLDRTDAEDYFIFSRHGFDWHEDVKIPQFVVGRRGYDNWIVSTALKVKDLKVIDATDTIHAVHQTTTQTEVRPEGDDRRLNYDMAVDFNYKRGHVTCAPWRTVSSNGTGSVVVSEREKADICRIRSGT